MWNRGQSGYTDEHGHLLAIPGIFIYASGDDLRGYQALYVGEADNIIVEQEKVPAGVVDCAVKHELSTLHVFFQSGKAQREDGQRDLTEGCRPLCQM